MPAARILGAGLSTALGHGLSANLDALQQAPPPHPLRRIPRALGDLQLRYAGLPPSPTDADAAARSTAILDRVVGEALASVSLSPAQRQGMALFVGSSSFNVAEVEQSYRADLAAGRPIRPLAHGGHAHLASALRRRLGLRGPDYSFSTACTASANAFACAAQMIDAGAIDHALVVGVELYNETTVLGFAGLELIAAETMRPFDLRRNGLIPGEGCAAVVLGRQGGHGALADWRLLGSANRCDSHSISAPSPDGSTVVQVIEQALHDAGVDAKAIATVKTHGTASLSNDEAEAAGMLAVFGQPPPLCAFKPYVGHTLGACGLIELLLLLGTLARAELPACPGVAASPEALGVALNQQRLPAPAGPIMANYFGFGGNNTSLILQRMEPGA